MTLWQSGGLMFGYVVYAVAWFGGGRAERFGAAVLILSNLVAIRVNGWEAAGIYPGIMVLDLASLLIFGWWCFQSDRWWPMVVTAASGLIVLADVIRLLDPTLSHYAMTSAKIGVAYVVDLALLLGVFERWLAGEKPASLPAWAKADRATAARRA